MKLQESLKEYLKNTQKKGKKREETYLSKFHVIFATVIVCFLVNVMQQQKLHPLVWHHAVLESENCFKCMAA